MKTNLLPTPPRVSREQHLPNSLEKPRHSDQLIIRQVWKGTGIEINALQNYLCKGLYAFVFVSPI